ncbi:MAG: penicillin-binding protein 2 [Nitrospiraceae bacterium]|nr:MAG: penicillin-binding protein 2 [Nitrospiraceae bacterium]
MDKRISIAFSLVLFILAILVIRLWHLQIIKGSEYKRLDERNRSRVIDIIAPRGVIYDRNGNPLVKNVLSFNVSMVSEDMPKDAETLAELGRLVGLETEQLIKLAKASTSPYENIYLMRDASFEEVAKVEARKIDFPGLQVEVSSSRGYLYGQTAAHVLGYLGIPTQKQLESPEYSGIPKQAFIGQFGIEKRYDRILRGIAGKKVVEVDALGNMIRSVRIQKPVRGKDLTLTIDVNVQMEAEKALQDKTGAVVAIKADTGEVLALASAPSFDPNLFVGGISYDHWKMLIEDSRKPLMNRAIQNQYPPGSTFKTVTALSALEKGIIDEDTTFFCGGSLFFGRTFRCWKDGGHGRVSLHRAIVESCDVYFYEVGKRIGIDTLAQYASAFGLGTPTDIELDGEASGIVPSTAWKLRTKKEKWYQGETLNTVIGQGYLTVTPIQMARLMAAAVNGGKLFKPHLVHGEHEGAEYKIAADIRPEYTEFVKKALLGVVYEGGGTARAARSDIVSIGGKTGTAQVIGGAVKEKDLPDHYKDHAWFTAFAPEYKPEIAVSVFVEHGGHGGSAAAPIARKVIEAHFNPPKPEEEMENAQVPEAVKQEEQVTTVQQQDGNTQSRESAGD